MARIGRVVIPGYPHHVTQQGNRRQKTFFFDDDYRYYIELMSEFPREAETEVWAYCLMPNHVHGIGYAMKVVRGADFTQRTYILEWTVDANEATEVMPRGETFCFKYSEDDWYENRTWESNKNNVLTNGNASEYHVTCAG